MQTLLLMDINKTPDSLDLNEEAALKITANELVNLEKEQKKKFHLLDSEYLTSYESTKDNEELMAELVGVKQEEQLYQFNFEENDKITVTKKDKGIDR